MSPSILRSEYVDDLQQHILHTQRHAEGIDDIVWGPDDLPHTVFPPGIVWTSEEKHLFFHALTRHSRFRPDLIASCIQTKSAVDVSAYLDVLEAARRAELSGSSGALDADLESESLVVEPSLEAHESLIAFEEKQSSNIIRTLKRKEAEVGWAGAKRAAQDIDELEDGPTSTPKKRRQGSFNGGQLSWKLSIAAHKAISAKYYPVEDEKNKQRGAESVRLLREQKLQGQIQLLHDAGLTEERLLQDGMDIFRLDRLAFLNKAFYANLIHDAGNNKQSKLNLTYRSLELLRRHLRSYISEVIHHTISIAYAHVESRQGTKSFGNVGDSKEVLAQHVEEAAKLVGLTWTCHSFLEDLPSRLSLDVVDFTPEGQEVIIQALDSPMNGGAHPLPNSVNAAPLTHERKPLELTFAWLPPQYMDEEAMEGDDDDDVNDEERLLKILDGEKEIEAADSQLDKAANSELRRVYGISMKRWRNEKKEKEEIILVSPY